MRVHGGDREARIDLSINTNPLGPPREVYDTLRECFEEKVIERYPDYSYRDLRRAIAEFYEAREDLVTPTNGAAEAINLVILSLRPSRIYVIEPSYGEYEDLSKILGIEYRDLYMRRIESRFYVDREDLKKICFDKESLLVITNPNNPTGAYTDREELIEILSKCSIRVLLDEAYIELCDKCPVNLIDHLSNIVIVRTFTKWLSIPGLRVGFVYTSDRELVRRIDILRQPWNINALSDCLLTRILVNKKDSLERFINETREYIRSERTRVRDLLKSLGIEIFDSDTNIMLLRIPRGEFVVKALRERKIAVRSCGSFRGLGLDYIRIGLKSRSDNDLFINTLREVLENVA